MNPSQRIQLPGSGRQGFLGDNQDDARGGLLGGAIGLGGRDQGHQETRARLGGAGGLVGRDQGLQMDNLHSRGGLLGERHGLVDQETREEDGGVVGLGGRELGHHQLLGGGRSAVQRGGDRGVTRRVHLAGVDDLRDHGQTGGQVLPAGGAFGGLGIASNLTRSLNHQLVDDSMDGDIEYLGQEQTADALSRGKLSIQDLVEMGMRMYKRCREGDVEPRKKKKEGVDDGDEEEEVVPVQFAGIDGQKDDGQDVICWQLRTGLLRPYTGDLREFWKRQPRVLHPIREAYDTSFLGQDPVNPLVTKRDHDRGAPRTAKQYLKVNLRVTKTKASITSSGLESHDVGLAKDYQEPTGVYQLMSGLWQYARNLFMIRRDDYSGFVMLAVLHDIKFFQPVLLAKVVGKSQRDSKQLECLKHFIDEAMARNSIRGKQGKPPMVYEELLSLARSSANLIYSGTGVGLDWQVDHGTCAIDPYTLGDSGQGGASTWVSGSVGTGGTRGGRPKKGGRGGQGQGGRGGGFGGGQSGHLGLGGAGSTGMVGSGGGRGSGGFGGGGHGVGNHANQGASGQAAGNPAGGHDHVGNICSLWNAGQCKYGQNCKFSHKCSRITATGAICGQSHKSKDH